MLPRLIPVVPPLTDLDGALTDPGLAIVLRLSLFDSEASGRRRVELQATNAPPLLFINLALARFPLLPQLQQHQQPRPGGRDSAARTVH